jgi:hypothetical protein
VIRLPRSPHYAQPQGGASIDWANPLTRGLLALLVPQRSGTVDLVSGRLLGRGSPLASAYGPGPAGQSLNAQANTSAIDWLDGDVYGGAIPAGVTWAALTNAGPAVTAASYWLGQGSSAANAPLAGLCTPSTGNLYRPRIQWRDDSSVMRMDVQTVDPVLSDLRPHAIVGSYMPGGDLGAIVAVDGALQATTAAVTTVAPTRLTSTSLALNGLRRASNGFTIRSQTYLGALWDRGLSADEASRLSANLSQLIASPRGRSFVPVAFAAAPAGVTGSSTQTLGAVTGTAAGAVISGIAGTSSVSLGAVTGSSAGAVSVGGTSSRTLDAVAGTATGQIRVSGLSSAALDAITGAASGVVGAAPVLGESSATLGPVIGSAAGVVQSAGLTGQSVQTIAEVSGSAAGTVRVAGLSGATVAGVTGAAGGAVAVRGVSGIDLGAVTGSATGSSLPVAMGSSVVTLAAVTGSAAGTVSDLPIFRPGNADVWRVPYRARAVRVRHHRG